MSGTAGVVREIESLGRRDGFEGCAAAAGPGGIGIDDAKAGAGEAVLEIEGGVAQEIGALGVDEELHLVALDDGVAFLAAIEGHLVLKAGATALGDLHAETFAGGFGLLGKEGTEVVYGVVGDVDHRSGTLSR